MISAGAKDSTGRCLWCTGWLLRTGDTKEDVLIKRRLGPLMLGLLAILSFLLVRGAFDDRLSPVRLASLALGAFICIAFLLVSLLGVEMKRVVGFSLVGFAVAVFLNDIYLQAELRVPVWPFTVLVLDSGLVFNTRRPVLFVIWSTLTYLAVQSAESAVLFGLYEAASGETPPVCDCGTPPCAVEGSEAFFNWTLAAIVLSGDFYLTRGFATNLQLQLRRVQASVAVAEEVVPALAEYDIDTAQTAIEVGGKDLPDELREAFRQLLGNLRCYRAYLPDSVLSFSATSTTISPMHTEDETPLALFVPDS
eukprot:Hpha_TRINITY_DN28230_c0_g1::TRINITY_DN28230_c0_g1_i1::g.116727::m.116727